jgi:hypothetical protein
MHKSAEDLRNAVEKRLGAPVNQRIWQRLLDDRWVNEVMGGFSTVGELLDQYRKEAAFVQEAARSSTARSEYRNPPPDTRAVLLSRLLVQEAERLPVVKQFRREHLPSGLLKEDEVEPWIEEQRGKDGKHTLWIELPLPLEPAVAEQLTSDRPPPPDLLARQSAAIKRKTLAYLGEDNWVRRCPVHVSGVLDKLRGLSKSLARKFDWREAAAAQFVLTGKTPLVASVRIKTQPSSSRVPSGAYNRVRVMLDVDPEIPPTKAVKAFREVRQRVRRGERYQPLSRKIATLVGFVLDRPEDTWEEKMRHWNEQYPEWRYGHSSNIAKDYHRAVRKLLPEPRWGGLID